MASCSNLNPFSQRTMSRAISGENSDLTFGGEERELNRGPTLVQIHMHYGHGQYHQSTFRRTFNKSFNDTVAEVIPPGQQTVWNNYIEIAKTIQMSGDIPRHPAESFETRILPWNMFSEDSIEVTTMIQPGVVPPGTRAYLARSFHWQILCVQNDAAPHQFATRLTPPGLDPADGAYAYNNVLSSNPSTSNSQGLSSATLSEFERLQLDQDDPYLAQHKQDNVTSLSFGQSPFYSENNRMNPYEGNPPFPHQAAGQHNPMAKKNKGYPFHANQNMTIDQNNSHGVFSRTGRWGSENPMHNSLQPRFYTSGGLYKESFHNIEATRLQNAHENNFRFPPHNPSQICGNPNGHNRVQTQYQHATLFSTSESDADTNFERPESGMENQPEAAGVAQTSLSAPKPPGYIVPLPAAHLFRPTRAKTGQNRIITSEKLAIAAAANLDLDRYEGDVSTSHLQNTRLGMYENCALYIKNIHPDATHKDFFDCVKTGKILHYHRSPPVRNTHYTAAAKLVFMERKGAAEFLKQARYGEGIELLGLHLEVSWNRARVGPTDPGIKSRVISICGPASELTAQGLLDFYNSKFDFSLVSVDEEIFDDQRAVQIAFGSFRPQALWAHQSFPEFLANKGFDPSNYRFAWMRDPCEPES